MAVMMFSMQILHGSINMIIHGFSHIAQEQTRHTGHDTETRGDDVNIPQRIRKRLLQGPYTILDDRRCNTRNLSQGLCIVGCEGADESGDRVGRKTGCRGGGGDIGGEFLVEARAEDCGVDGGEDGGGHGSRGGCHGGGGGDETMRGGELDARDDQDERGTETQTGETGKGDEIGRVARLDRRHTDDTGGEDYVAGEQRGANCAEAS